jgi:transposase-like protein
MVQVLHKCATTTQRVRKEIQDSKESILKIAKRYNINPKTVQKWKKRKNTNDAPMGAKKVNTVLTELEEKIICEFRRSTKLSLDDCYINLKPQIPKLSRSNLHRCLKRNDLSRLPKEEENKREKKQFKKYEIGYLHVDITEIRLDKKKYQIFVAIDRVTKYAYAEVYEDKTIEKSKKFLKNLIKAYPNKINTILTDNGVQFTYRCLPEGKRPKKTHPFTTICRKGGIRHKLIQFRSPWTNGQVEIFNKTIKENTTRKYKYDSIKSLKSHLNDFLMIYNFQRKLKSLKYISPYDKMIEEWNKNPKCFNKNPYHYTVGLNS